MPFYRKKPVVIEAHRIEADKLEDLARWSGGEPAHIAPDCPATGITIPTMEGPLHGSIGDYLICGIKGEFYSCKPDIFEATYEPAIDKGDPAAGIKTAKE